MEDIPTLSERHYCSQTLSRSQIIQNKSLEKELVDRGRSVVSIVKSALRPTVAIYSPPQMQRRASLADPFPSLVVKIKLFPY